MTPYDAQEISQEGGSPVEIYRFSVGAQSFFYTSAEAVQTIAAITYDPIAIERGRLETGVDKRGTTIEIRVPTPNEVAQLFILTIPGLTVSVQIDRLHRLDTPTPEVRRVFDGTVISVSYVENMKRAKIICQPAIATLGRTVPRFTYQNACNHVLYDGGCKVDDTDPAFRASNQIVTGAAASVLTIAGLGGSFLDGWFDGGMVEVLGGTDYRTVRSHVGDDLTLMSPFGVTPTNVNVFAGCGHDIATCKAKFDAVLNYGGFAFVPTDDIWIVGIQ